MGYYDEKGLVDIVLAGEQTSKEYVRTKTLIHAGVDLIAPLGSEIRPIADGVVDDIISSDKDPDFPKGLGYMVLLKHKDYAANKPTYSIYLHLQNGPATPLGSDRRRGEDTPRPNAV